MKEIANNERKESRIMKKEIANNERRESWNNKWKESRIINEKNHGIIMKESNGIKKKGIIDV